MCINSCTDYVIYDVFIKSLSINIQYRIFISYWDYIIDNDEMRDY